MKLDDEAGAVIKKHCQELQSMDIFSCSTIESTAQAQGEDVVWYPAQYYIARNRQTGEALFVADMPHGSDEIELADPMPVKLLLHPFRPGHAGSPLDLTMFREAVEECAVGSKAWSLKTAAKGMTRRRKAGFVMDESNYPDPESRAELLDEIHRRWKGKPICTSVIIKVWQRYLEIAAGGDPDASDLAAQYILRFMSLWSDSTLPSGLLKELSMCNWVLRGNVDA
jgi:hypothetical protein